MRSILVKIGRQVRRWLGPPRKRYVVFNIMTDDFRGIGLSKIEGSDRYSLHISQHAFQEDGIEIDIEEIKAIYDMVSTFSDDGIELCGSNIMGQKLERVDYFKVRTIRSASQMGFLREEYSLGGKRWKGLECRLTSYDVSIKLIFSSYLLSEFSSALARVIEDDREWQQVIAKLSRELPKNG